MSNQYDSWGFPVEVRRVTGSTEYPAHCERHGEHYWCDVCEGYYGVPHEYSHLTNEKHAAQCVCRPRLAWDEYREMAWTRLRRPPGTSGRTALR